jgi:Tyrosyl-DNA phosphodiesterase
MSRPDKKRQRIDDYDLATSSQSLAGEIRSRRSNFLSSLNRGVSPPGASGRQLSLQAKMEPEMKSQTKSETVISRMFSVSSSVPERLEKAPEFSKPQIIPSPFKLTRIRDLPAMANVDTIGVRDILGQVMLKEVWLFDYLFDIDWVM